MKLAEEYGISRTPLREALKGYRSINGAPAMMELLKKHGAESLQALAKDKYQAVYADAIKAE